MSKRSLAVLGVLAASASAVVLTTTPAFASSGDVLSYGAPNPSGTDVGVGDVLTGALATGTTNSFVFTSGGKTVTIACSTAAMAATVGTNPPAPGTADLSLTALTFSSCTLTGLSGVTVSSVSLNGAATGDVTSSPADLNITSLDERVVLDNGLGKVNCDYGNTSTESPIVGTILNPGAGGTISFQSQPVHLLSGLSVCGSSGSVGSFTAEFGSIADSSHGGALVYDN